MAGRTMGKRSIGITSSAIAKDFPINGSLKTGSCLFIGRIPNYGQFLSKLDKANLRKDFDKQKYSQSYSLTIKDDLWDLVSENHLIIINRGNEKIAIYDVSSNKTRIGWPKFDKSNHGSCWLIKDIYQEKYELRLSTNEKCHLFLAPRSLGDRKDGACICIIRGNDPDNVNIYLNRPSPDDSLTMDLEILRSTVEQLLKERLQKEVTDIRIFLRANPGDKDNVIFIEGTEYGIGKIIRSRTTTYTKRYDEIFANVVYDQWKPMLSMNRRSAQRIKKVALFKRSGEQETQMLIQNAKASEWNSTLNALQQTDFDLFTDTGIDSSMTTWQGNKFDGGSPLHTKLADGTRLAVIALAYLGKIGKQTTWGMLGSYATPMAGKLIELFKSSLVKKSIELGSWFPRKGHEGPKGRQGRIVIFNPPIKKSFLMIFDLVQDNQGTEYIR